MSFQKRNLRAVVTDAGLCPAFFVEREYVGTVEKGGWIRLNWEMEPNSLGNLDTGEEGVKDKVTWVSRERALQAMAALARDELTC